MGGVITVESTLGRGSTFQFVVPFTLPLQVANLQVPPEIEVIIMVQNRHLSQSLAKLVAGVGLKSYMVSNNLDLEEVTKSLSPKKMTVLMIDSFLVSQQNVDLLRKFSTVILGAPEEEKRFTQSLDNRFLFLVKPVKRSTVIKLLSASLAASPRHEIQTPTFPGMDQFHILIVEDNIMNQESTI